MMSKRTFLKTLLAAGGGIALGSCKRASAPADVQAQMQALLERLVDEGKERAIHLVVYVKGQMVINARAGFIDVAKTRPVQEDTLYPVFSVTKGVTATRVNQLVQAGKISYDTRIAEVWPEFAANGKENVTLRQGLAHSIGIPYLPGDLTVEQVHDWDFMCNVVANLKPEWEPGTKAEYHGLTYGWIVGEVARRIDGRPFAQQVVEEIGVPLGVQDGLWIGAPVSEAGRIIEMVVNDEDPLLGTMPDEGKNGAPLAMRPLVRWMELPGTHQSNLPAGSGIFTAHAVARHYAALLPSGCDGVHLLSQEQVRQATAFEGDTLPFRAGGYTLFDVVRDDRRQTFGHYGYAGAIGWADPRYELAFAIAKDRGSATEEIIDTVRGVLKMPR